MTEDVPGKEGEWERVEPDPIHYDYILIALTCALGLAMFLRALRRLPEEASVIGLALACTSFIVILVSFLAFMMWRMRRVRSDAIRRSVGRPWRRIVNGVEEVLDEEDIEFRREVKGWRGPSYNWASGTFRQVYHMPKTDLSIYVESKDPTGTREGGHPTHLSIGPVTDDTRVFVDRLTVLLDEAFPE